jgi:CRP/FNR family transcriptional regulator, anaerobic regulatory protein
MNNNIDSLHQLQYFFKQLVPGFTSESWETTAGVLSVRNFKKGEFLVREGQVCNYVSFINKGLVRLYHIVNGREKVICFAAENEYTSEYRSFLNRMPSDSFVQALEETEVVEMSYHDLQMLYAKVPEANLIGRLICEQMFQLISDTSQNKMRENVAHRYRRLIQDTPWLIQRVPQYMIASYLGITPEALSRIKSKTRKAKQFSTLLS